VRRQSDGQVSFDASAQRINGGVQQPVFYDVPEVSSEWADNQPAVVIV
jgi:hypothetical protein